MKYQNLNRYKLEYNQILLFIILLMVIVIAIILFKVNPSERTKNINLNNISKFNSLVVEKSNSRIDYMSHDVYSSLYQGYFDRVDAEVPFLIDIHMSPITNNTVITENLVKAYYLDYKDKGAFRADYNAQTHYNRFLDYYKSQNPSIPVGIHISGADCNSNPSSDEMVMVNCDSFNANEIFDSPFLNKGRFRINISQEKARNKFITLLIEKAKDYRIDILYLDNINHNASWKDCPFDWETTTRFLSELNKELDKINVSTVVNVAVPPWALYKNEYKDAKSLMEAVDGMSFEMPFHRNIRQDLINLEKETAVTRLWLDNGKVVMYVPVWSNTPKQKVHDYYLAAGLAMILRNPGDKIFVSRPYWTGDYSWIDWPSKYGTPMDNLPMANQLTNTNISLFDYPKCGCNPYFDYMNYEGRISKNNEGVTLTREFRDGKIQVMFISSSKGIAEFSLPSDGFKLYKVPVNGSLELLDDKKVHYFSNNYIGSEVFILGKDYDSINNYYKNILIVSVYSNELPIIWQQGSISSRGSGRTTGTWI